MRDINGETYRETIRAVISVIQLILSYHTTSSRMDSLDNITIQEAIWKKKKEIEEFKEIKTFLIGEESEQGVDADGECKRMYGGLSKTTAHPAAKKLAPNEQVHNSRRGTRTNSTTRSRFLLK